MKRVLLIGMVAALACAGLAQGGGQGRGGGMRMFGRGGGGLQLATRDDVAKELKLTSDQKTKIEDLQEKAREEMRAQFESMRGAGGPPDDATMATMRKKMEDMQAEQKKQLNAILTPEQATRLKELGIRRAGNMAIMDPEVQTDLGLDADQKAKIKDLQDKQMAAFRAVREKIQNQEMDPSEIRPLMEKNMKIMGDELMKILTADQKTKFEAMKGKPFTFDEDEENGG